MTDDIYEHIRFEGGTAPHLLAAAPELRDRTLAINGVSKTYAMTGWRIGWAAGPRSLIQALDTLPVAGGRQLPARSARRPPPRRSTATRASSPRASPSTANGATRTAAGHQRDPRPVVPPAGRRLLPLRQLRRPDRHARRRTAAGSPPMATSSCTCWKASASRSWRAPPTACRPISGCRSRPRIETLDDGVARIARAVADLS